METEASSIDSFDVYETAPLEQAEGHRILSSKWVHRLTETICRSRILVRGFEQLWTEALTSSHTPSLTTPPLYSQFPSRLECTSTLVSLVTFQLLFYTHNSTKMFTYFHQLNYRTLHAVLPDTAGNSRRHSTDYVRHHLLGTSTSTPR